MVIMQDDKKYLPYQYNLEEEFEADVVRRSSLIFGPKTIYIDAKKKIGTGFLGGAVPDGFLFDMSDPEDRAFYLVEVELERHDFNSHIFPQITKFFAFFKSNARQQELVQKLFQVIHGDAGLEKAFKGFLGNEEIYKFLHDIVDESQNILLVLDGEKSELPEIQETYQDTWGEAVKVMVIRKYVCNSNCLFTVEPELKALEYSIPEDPTKIRDDKKKHTEEEFLSRIDAPIRDVYMRLKNEALIINPSFCFNPTKYYVSIKGTSNLLFITFAKKHLRLVVMLPEDQIRKTIKAHDITTLSQSVQKFWGGHCAAVFVKDLANIEEVVELIRAL